MTIHLFWKTENSGVVIGMGLVKEMSKENWEGDELYHTGEITSSSIWDNFDLLLKISNQVTFFVAKTIITGDMGICSPVLKRLDG